MLTAAVCDAYLHSCLTWCVRKASSWPGHESASAWVIISFSVMSSYAKQGHEILKLPALFRYSTRSGASASAGEDGRAWEVLAPITSSLLFLFLKQQWGYHCLPCLPPVVESVCAALVPLAMLRAAERGGGRGRGRRPWRVTAADCAYCALGAVLAITCSSTHPATLPLSLIYILILSFRGYCHTVWTNNTSEQFRTTKIEYNAKRVRAEWEKEN